MTQGASYVLTATVLKTEGMPTEQLLNIVNPLLAEPQCPVKIRALLLMAKDVLIGKPNEFLKDAMISVDDPTELYNNFYGKPLSFFADHIIAAIAMEVDEEAFNGYVSEVEEFMGRER